MKYRIMSYDEPLKDFDSESEAFTAYKVKVEKVKKDKIKGDIIPSCHIHKCFHDESPSKPCEIIEQYSKE